MSIMPNLPNPHDTSSPNYGRECPGCGSDDTVSFQLCAQCVAKAAKTPQELAADAIVSQSFNWEGSHEALEDASSIIELHFPSEKLQLAQSLALESAIVNIESFTGAWGEDPEKPEYYWHDTSVVSEEDRPLLADSIRYLELCNRIVRHPKTPHLIHISEEAAKLLG